MRFKKPSGKKKPRMILYGPKKIGKSSFASQALEPVFCATESGVDNVPVAQARATTWAELLKDVGSIANGEHGYKTIVIDTINGAVEMCAEHVCKTQFSNNWGPGGYQSFGQGARATAQEIKKLLPLLDACREKGMYVLMLAHTGLLNVKNPIGGDFTKYAPDMDKNSWSIISAWLDIIMRAEFDHTIVEEKTGKSKAVGGDAKRIVYTQGSIAEDAGCRVGYSLPETIELTWDDFEKGLSGESKLMKLFNLLYSALSDEKQQKVLQYLKIKSLNEIETINENLVRKIVAKMEKS